MRRVIRCRDTESQTRGYRYVYCFELCNYVHCYGRVSVKIHLKISFSRPSPTRILKIIFSYSEKSKKKLYSIEYHSRQPCILQHCKVTPISLTKVQFLKPVPIGYITCARACVRDSAKDTTFPYGSALNLLLTKLQSIES